MRPEVSSLSSFLPAEGVAAGDGQYHRDADGHRDLAVGGGALPAGGQAEVVGEGGPRQAGGEVGGARGGGEDHVAHQGAEEDGPEDGQQPPVPEEGHVPDAPHHAQAGALGQSRQQRQLNDGSSRPPERAADRSAAGSTPW